MELFYYSCLRHLKSIGRYLKKKHVQQVVDTTIICFYLLSRLPTASKKVRHDCSGVIRTELDVIYLHGHVSNFLRRY